MLFNSFPFVVLVAVTFVLFYLPPLQRWQTLILIVSSFVFYAWEVPGLLALLIFSILVNSLVSQIIAYREIPRLLRIFIAGLALNLFILTLFKYGPLVARTLSMSESGFGRLLVTMPLPIGISFYTFESISLLIDLWRHREASRPPFIPREWLRHIQHTSLFFAFFPHLISGPILKADEFYPQIGPKRIADIPWPLVFRFCVTGFFLKMVVADNLKEFTSQMAYPSFMRYSSLTLIAMLFGFSMQIFADFAGYSAIALGLGLMFGYQLPINFNFPYIATSLADFWRRWHMSLSTWLREYLYFPLGGSRRGKKRMYFNLFLVMTLGGLWHGAAWSFAVWGLYHGTGLAAERWFEDSTGGALGRLPAALRIAGVFTFVSLGWLLFKLTDFDQAILYLKALFLNWNSQLENPLTWLIAITMFSAPVVVYHVIQMLPAIHTRVRRHESWIYGAMLAALVVSHGPPGSFLYFQF